MDKKKFSIPFVVLDSGLNPGGDASEGAGGSADTGFEPFPCSFADWQKSFAVDCYPLEPDDKIDFDDYGQWWADNEFSLDDWKKFNGDTPFTWE